MKFLIDAQLPPKLAQWLADQGHSATHVHTINLTAAEDSVIWDHAQNAGAIIVTKDEDFAERTSRTATGPIIVWLRVGNTTNRALLRWLEPRWPAIIQLLTDGHRLIEVR